MNRNAPERPSSGPTRVQARRVALGVLVVIILSVLSIAGYLGVKRAQEFHAEGVESRAATGAYVSAVLVALPKYCAQIARLREEPFFLRRPGGEDAGEFLNSRIAWGATPQDLDKMGVDEPELEPEEPLQMSLTGQAWLRVEPVDIPDTGWMAQLHAYGHWSLLTGPLQRLEPVPPFEHPLPKYRSLMSWAKIRFLRGFRDGDLGAASRDVQHLAFLSISTGHPAVVQTGAAMLRFDSDAYAEASRRALDVGDWRPITAAQVNRFSKLALATSMFADPWLPQAVVDQARRCAAELPLSCILLSEEAMLTVLVRTVQPSQFSDRIRVLEAELANHGLYGCDLSLPNAYWVRRVDGSPEQRACEPARLLEYSNERTMEGIDPIRRAILEKVAEYTLTRQRQAMAAVDKDRPARLARYITEASGVDLRDPADGGASRNVSR